MVEFITQGPLKVFWIGGLKIAITKPMLVCTGAMIVLSLLMIYLASGLKVIPESKKQVAAETIYLFVHGIVKDNMGEKLIHFVPFIGSLIIYIMGQNMTGLFGFKPATSSFSTALGLGLSAVAMMHYNAIKTGGVGGYLKSYVKPMPFLLPITLMERIILPISLSLRLFGNILAAAVIMTLVYSTLIHINAFAALVIPIPFHAYFDIFDGGLQAVIFTFLTMIQMKLLAEESTEAHGV